jgi:hypothetical protein
VIRGPPELPILPHIAPSDIHPPGLLVVRAVLDSNRLWSVCRFPERRPRHFPTRRFICLTLPHAPWKPVVQASAAQLPYRRHTRPEPGESTRQTSGDGRRNPGAGAVGLSSRFRQSELSHQQCPARSGAQVPAPELVQVGYLPADFGQQDWRRVSRQERLTVSARQTAMPFRPLCPLRTKSSSCRQ